MATHRRSPPRERLKRLTVFLSDEDIGRLGFLAKLRGMSNPGQMVRFITREFLEKDTLSVRGIWKDP